jgi:hypothetical protein
MKPHSGEKRGNPPEKGGVLGYLFWTGGQLVYYAASYDVFRK